MREMLGVPFCCICCILLMRTVMAGGEKNDLKKLQGEWMKTDSIYEGERIPPDKGPAKIVVASDQLRVVENNGKITRLYRIEIDPTKNPAHMDFYLKLGEDEKGPLRAIYSLDGETLRICLPRLPSQERPKEFSSPKDSKLGLTTFKRANPK